MDFSETIWIEAVDPLLAIHLHPDEPRVAKYLQMLGYGRSAEAELADEGADRSGSFGEQFDNAPAIRFGESSEAIHPSIISFHLIKSIQKQMSCEWAIVMLDAAKAPEYNK